jgi:hypothetical protein
LGKAARATRAVSSGTVYTACGRSVMAHLPVRHASPAVQPPAQSIAQVAPTLRHGALNWLRQERARTGGAAAERFLAALDHPFLAAIPTGLAAGRPTGPN